MHLVKPLTYMNASGRGMPALLQKTGTTVEEILVVFDSLDLPPGSCRLKLKGSAGGHKGLASIIQRLGTEDFMRLAVGIGRPQTREGVVEYVLGVPDGQEAEAVESGISQAVQAVLQLLSEGPARAMSDVNRRDRQV